MRPGGKHPATSLDCLPPARLNGFMRPSPHVRIRVDLGRVAKNARAIRRRCLSPVIAVVKSDAYGLGIERVATAIAAEVDEFCVFSFAEAADSELWRKTQKPILVLGPDTSVSPADYVAHHARPAVWDVARATALRDARPVLSVDTGMQRFACSLDQVDAVLEAGRCNEAFTHATRLGHIEQLLSRLGGRGLRLHAAGTSLLEEPLARLDAVRPGRALYEGAVRVSVPLVETHSTSGPAGYSSFAAARHGVILAGYSNGLRPGPCLLNDRITRIIEVGMQSAYIEIAAQDAVGDEVVLLGDIITESEIALSWQTSPQEVLVRLCGAGVREYVEAAEER